VNPSDRQIEHLQVSQSVFGGDRFWAPLDRLAQRLGHDEHQRFLRGVPEPTNWYEFYCGSCEQVIAAMAVHRDDDQPGRPAAPVASRGR
jgi:hypothetical protein